MATLIMQPTTGGNFSAQSRDARELVAWAVEKANSFRNFSDLSPCRTKKGDGVNGRMDVTDEKSSEDGKDVLIHKLQVQNGKETHASVMIRNNAIVHCTQNPASPEATSFPALLAHAIQASYDRLAVYEIVYQ